MKSSLLLVAATEWPEAAVQITIIICAAWVAVAFWKNILK